MAMLSASFPGVTYAFGIVSAICCIRASALPSGSQLDQPEASGGASRTMSTAKAAIPSAATAPRTA